ARPDRAEVGGERLQLRGAVAGCRVAEVVDDAGHLVDGAQMGAQAPGQHAQCHREVLRPLAGLQVVAAPQLPGRPRTTGRPPGHTVDRAHPWYPHGSMLLRRVLKICTETSNSDLAELSPGYKSWPGLREVTLMRYTGRDGG